MQLQKIVNQENQKCWGKPLGSEILWKGHVETIQRIQEMATQIKIKEVCAFFSVHLNGIFSINIIFINSYFLNHDFFFVFAMHR